MENRVRFPYPLPLAATDAALRDGEDAVLLTRTEGRTGDGDFYSPSHSAPLTAGAELELLTRRGNRVEARLPDALIT